MLLNSMAAACLQCIWVMVCIPNHLSWASGLRFPCKSLTLNYDLEFTLCLLKSVFAMIPEAAVAVQVSIAGVTAKGGVLATDAAPWKLFLITV